MGINTPLITTFTLAAVLSSGLNRSGLAQTGEAGRMRTQNAVGYRVEQLTKPSSLPSPNLVWLPGFWDLQGDPRTAPAGGWVWVPGRWVLPPVPSARWNPGHWGWRNDWWSWIAGHWDEPRGARPRELVGRMSP